MHTSDTRAAAGPPASRTSFVRARTQQIVLAAVADAVIVVGLVVLAIAFGRGLDLEALGVALLVVAVLISAAAAWAAMRRRLGAGPGELLLRVRAIDAASRMPPALPGRRQQVYDVSAGLDPLRLAETASHLPSASEAYVADAPAYITIAIDDGRRFSVRRHAVIGHRPGVLVEPPDATQIVLTDFSRTVDRIHALVTLVPHGIRVEALTDRAETWIEQHDRRMALAPGTSTEVEGPVDLVLGERRLRLARRDAKAGSW
ncbi:hypothetical protein [Brachybacterium fresconis]|uniref:FHA domain-containing protein n=1 Tax=Brachybacterium fresconis TaxID=173363 RepID=A0ABS4YEX0_9MICO|nr:hypothetical protein [Brachybacterium fresconis]MBP2407318.1 hypothetical protein [Brachybacterium fresconis]